MQMTPGELRARALAAGEVCGGRLSFIALSL